MSRPVSKRMLFRFSEQPSNTRLTNGLRLLVFDFRSKALMCALQWGDQCLVVCSWGTRGPESKHGSVLSQRHESLPVRTECVTLQRSRKLLKPEMVNNRTKWGWVFWGSAALQHPFHQAEMGFVCVRGRDMGKKKLQLLLPSSVDYKEEKLKLPDGFLFWNTHSNFVQEMTAVVKWHWNTEDCFYTTASRSGHKRLTLTSPPQFGYKKFTTAALPSIHLLCASPTPQTDKR